MPEKVLAAMSGGVDSSVAAGLLKRQGYEVAGVMLRLFDERAYGVEPASRTCCSITDVDDARRAALKLGIHFAVFNYAGRFKEEVIQRFYQAYMGGRTPNPCLDCNRYIKFAALLAQAEAMGFGYIATGHYARTGYDKTTGRHTLRKGPCAEKDQSYVLYTLTQSQLSRLLLPVGELGKDEVRSLARALGLANAAKPDSQDICFVPDGDYAAFLGREFGVMETPGDFVDENGTVLGTHRGIWHYTVGQRHGLGISGPYKLYVKHIDAAKNQVVLAGAEGLLAQRLVVESPNWVSIPEPREPLRAMVRTRYHGHEAAVTLHPQPGGGVLVVFDTPQRRPASGQAAVFYDGDLVLGGGEIQKSCEA